jgi:hypothetical protein
VSRPLVVRFDPDGAPWVGGGDAQPLAFLFGLLLRYSRTHGVAFPPWAVDALAQLEVAADRERSSSPLSHVVPVAFDRSALGRAGYLLSSADVAELVGVSEQATTLAARTGRLAGVQDDKGRWWFSREAADEWQRARQARTRSA